MKNFQFSVTLLLVGYSHNEDYYNELTLFSEY